MNIINGNYNYPNPKLQKNNSQPSFGLQTRGFAKYVDEFLPRAEASRRFSSGKIEALKKGLGIIKNHPLTVDHWEPRVYWLNVTELDGKIERTMFNSPEMTFITRGDNTASRHCVAEKGEIQNVIPRIVDALGEYDQIAAYAKRCEKAERILSAIKNKLAKLKKQAISADSEILQKRITALKKGQERASNAVDKLGEKPSLDKFFDDSTRYGY